MQTVCHPPILDYRYEYVRKYRDLLINLNLLLLAIIATVVVIIIFWNVMTVIFPVLLLLLIALLLAFLLNGLVVQLQHRGVNRGLSVLIIFLLLIAAMFAAGDFLLAPLAQQLVALGGNIPADQAKLHAFLNNLDKFANQHGIPIHLNTQQILNYAKQFGKSALGSTLDIVLGISNTVIDTLAVIVMSLYLLFDGPRLHHNILRVVPESQRNHVLFFEATIRTVVGSYVRGQLVLAFIIGVLAAVGTFILGVHYPLVIGLIAGFFELVPMLGPIAGAIPAVGIAYFQNGWEFALVVVLLFVVIQQLEAHIIAPRVMGHAVGVHPVIAILAVLLGARLDGFLGALVAVPVAGIVYIIAQAIYFQLIGEQHTITVVREPPFYMRWITGAGRKLNIRGFRHGRPVTVTVQAPNEQLAEIARERDMLAQQFERAEVRVQETSESSADQAEYQDQNDGADQGDQRRGQEVGHVGAVDERADDQAPDEGADQPYHDVAEAAKAASAGQVSGSGAGDQPDQ